MAGTQECLQWTSEHGDKKMPELARVEDQINDQHLRLIEQMFREANTAGGGGLDMKDFREAMKKIMEDVEDEDIDTIFMKVDSNCDGSMEWDDYLNYMLLEYREKDTLQQKNRPLFFPKPLKIVLADHHELIVGLQFYSFQHPPDKKKVDPGEQGAAGGCVTNHVHGGRYLSISQNGTLNFWSERFKLQRTVQISKMAHTTDQPILVTNMVCLDNINQLCISFTGRDIEFYDISASKCDVVYSLCGLEANAVVMDYWSHGHRGIYSIGDTSGTVYIFTSTNVIQNGLFNSVAFKTGTQRSLSHPLPECHTTWCLITVEALHSDWIRQIRYLPDLNVVATCCTTDRNAMALTTVPHSTKREIHTVRFHLKKGIQCFDYSPELNVLVTGGFDRVIRVWNPYVTCQATFQMKGCSAAITHIMVNDKQNKVISVSKDKNVCVWDLEDGMCLQNIHPKNISMGQFPISCTYCNPDTSTVVLATYKASTSTFIPQIGVLYGVVDSKNNTITEAVTSHEKPLCAALYNANFRQVVSGCHAGVVSVWDILSGEMVMQFQTSPKQQVEVTAMAFDGPKRRLFTGSKDGKLRLWNFNNGALLEQLPLVDNSEITGILYINDRIYVSGWSKRVVSYLDLKDGNTEMDYNVWNQYHTEDIYSMDVYGNKLLVTGSYNGDIILWNIDSRQAFCRLNASESALPLVPVRQVLDKGSRDTDTVQKVVVSETSTKARGCSFQGPSENGSEMKVGQKSKADHVFSRLDTPCMAVEKVLFLNTRERSPGTAILLSSAADGYVYAWSVSHGGGLLGKFKPAQQEGSVVSAMSTDSNNRMLLTGDSHGYIMLWDIEKYCYQMHDEGSCQDKSHSEESLRQWELIPHYCRVQGPRRVKVQQEKEGTEWCKVKVMRYEHWGCQVIDGWSVFLTPPKLLSSWRCHLKGIVHLEYAERYSLVVTASLDCNVRLWTIAGRYIGTFGQSSWQVGKLETMPRELPVDLKRVGSYQTLKVLNEGQHPHWRLGWVSIKFKMNLVIQTSQQDSKTERDCVSPNSDVQIEICQQEELSAVDTPVCTYSPEQIEQIWALRPEKGKQLRVFNTMPCTNLLPIAQPPLPDILKHHHQRMQETSEAVPKQKKSSRPCPTARYMA
ncbi:hypothetical protein NFI96_030672 [Prochilodus magdalenae]|nr:hypothetical protein NFI96_030672 [Prochilodus magdalenae]